MKFAISCLSALAVFVCSSLASAHDGPPYPICVDEAIGSMTLSIWADPDVGEGTFYYYLDPPANDVLVEARARSQDPIATEVCGLSQAPGVRAPYQQIGTLPFEHRGRWNVTFSLMEGEAALGKVDLEVNVTPPGLGRLYLLWYAIPFVAAAAFWLRILTASRPHLIPARDAAGDSSV